MLGDERSNRGTVKKKYAERCVFEDPSILREGYRLESRLAQVATYGQVGLRLTSESGGECRFLQQSNSISWNGLRYASCVQWYKTEIFGIRDAHGGVSRASGGDLRMTIAHPERQGPSWAIIQMRLGIVSATLEELNGCWWAS